MQHLRDALHRQLSVALAASALAALGLGACGGSSGSASTAAQTNAASRSAAAGSSGGASTSTSGSTTGSTKSSTTKAQGTSGVQPRFTAIRECLRRDGVTLPANRTGGLFLAGAQLRKGMTRAQAQATMRKCLVGRLSGGPGGPVGTNRTGTSAFRQALSKFAECPRQHGVNVPMPNASGKGPVLSTKGLNTASPQFRAATAKCRGVLANAFKRKP
jgi:hypothetical protein